jgi:hypothetical protein
MSSLFPLATEESGKLFPPPGPHFHRVPSRGSGEGVE